MDTASVPGDLPNGISHLNTVPISFSVLRYNANYANCIFAIGDLASLSDAIFWFLNYFKVSVQMIGHSNPSMVV